MLHRSAAPGNLTEYGLLLGSVALLAIGGLVMLGTSSSSLFGKANGQLSSSDMTDYVSMKFSRAPQAGASSSQAGPSVSTNAQAGQPAISLTENGTSKNATSADGMVSSAQATMLTVQKMDSLMTEITDPKVLQWAEKITQASHYVGGAEGDFSGVRQLTVTTAGKDAYTSANALRDIYSQQATLQKLINSPPKNADAAQVRKVQALANDVVSNTAPFTANLDPYMKKDGTVDNGQLARSEFANGRGKLSGKHYQDLVKYDTLQQNVQSVLQDGSAANTPALQSTLQDASTLNQTSQTQP